MQIFFFFKEKHKQLILYNGHILLPLLIIKTKDISQITSLLLLLFHPSPFLPVSLSVSQSTHQLFSLSLAAPSHLSEVIYSRLSPPWILSTVSDTKKTCSPKILLTCNHCEVKTQSQCSHQSPSLSPRLLPASHFLHFSLPLVRAHTLRAQWASHTDTHEQTND